MSIPTSERPVIDAQSDIPDWDDVMVWRLERLTAAGFGIDLAVATAANRGYDLHEVLSLLDRGCPPELAARIAAPLDGGEQLR